jgi:hypothetical protein
MPPLVPVLFTISLGDPNPDLEHPFTTIGTADRLAKFILKQFKMVNLSWNEATCIAIDAIERIKDDDIRCGGTTQFGTVFERKFVIPTATVDDDNFVNNIVNELKPYRKKNDARSKKQFNLVIKRLQSEFVNSTRKLQEMRIEQVKQNQVLVAKNWPPTDFPGKSVTQEIKPDEKS